MKKAAFILVLLAMTFFPFIDNVSAHETRQYMIGGQGYQIVVGSLNEPIAVDDRTGVSISVSTLSGASMGHGHGGAEGAVEGLDQTLKVEISAGDKKRVLDLAPIHGEPGAYRANFIPTVQTTYVYRFFGTINKIPIDLSFSCNPAGHPASPEDTNRVELSDGVTQTLKRGSYGCPEAKADLGFPEQAMTYTEIGDAVSGSRTVGMAALGVAAVALVFAMRRRN